MEAENEEVTFDSVTFDSWRKDMELRSTQFKYWSIALKMEMIFFMFVRSIRSRNFVLFKYAIDQLLPE